MQVSRHEQEYRRRDEAGQCAGLILAGGQARRMGGGDKTLLEVGRRTLLGHVVARLGPQVAWLAISANGDAGRFATYGLPVVADAAPGEGPLAGVLAGLRWAAGQGADWLVSLPGDTPFPPPDLVARLAASGAPAAFAASGGRDHWAVMRLHVSLANDLAARFAAGLRAPRQFLALHGAARVDWPDAPRDPFENINTPEELEAARRGQ